MFRTLILSILVVSILADFWQSGSFILVFVALVFAGVAIEYFIRFATTGGGTKLARVITGACLVFALATMVLVFLGMRQEASYALIASLVAFVPTVILGGPRARR